MLVYILNSYFDIYSYKIYRKLLWFMILWQEMLFDGQIYCVEEEIVKLICIYVYCLQYVWLS